MLGEGLLANGWYGILQSAGLLFFAFAGYARIATMGEEVMEPRRTIPRAIIIALGITVVVYAVIAVTVLSALGPDGVAGNPTPLAAAVESGTLAWASPVVRIGLPLRRSARCWHSLPAWGERVLPCTRVRSSARPRRRSSPV